MSALTRVDTVELVEDAFILTGDVLMDVILVLKGNDAMMVRIAMVHNLNS